MCTHFVVQKLQCCFCVCCLPWSCLATLTQFVCVCRPAVCLLYFHVSQWVISALVIAIATMRWHMPPCSLCDWQDCCSGKMQRMLGQVTPLPLPSSSDIQCVTHFFPLLVLFMYNKPPPEKNAAKENTDLFLCNIHDPAHWKKMTWDDKTNRSLNQVIWSVSIRLASMFLIKQLFGCFVSLHAHRQESLQSYFSLMLSCLEEESKLWTASIHLITWLHTDFQKEKKKDKKKTLEKNPADLLRRQIWTLGNTMTCMCGGYIWEVKHSVSIQLAIGKQRALFMPVYPVYACCFLCKPLWNLPLSQLLFSCCVHLISVMSTVTDAC